MNIRWDPLKNEWLKRTRGISFEEILHAKFIAIEEHPKRSNQKPMLFKINDYIWTVPFVRTGDDMFLKTLFPSRMYTKKWIQGESK